MIVSVEIKSLGIQKPEDSFVNCNSMDINRVTLGVEHHVVIVSVTLLFWKSTDRTLDFILITGFILLHMQHLFLIKFSRTFLF